MFEILQGIASAMCIYLIIDSLKNMEESVLSIEKHGKRIIDVKNKHMLVPLFIFLITFLFF